MVWPLFLGSDGCELLHGELVPNKCEANFYIVDPEMRRNVHLHRVHVGLEFNIVEGSRMVARCRVKRLLSLIENAE